jgi:hypothetical protein
MQNEVPFSRGSCNRDMRIDSTLPVECCADHTYLVRAANFQYLASSLLHISQKQARIDSVWDMLPTKNTYHKS